MGKGVVLFSSEGSQGANISQQNYFFIIVKAIAVANLLDIRV